MKEPTQDDRCSMQQHLWRRREQHGLTFMACKCGAVHPNDIDAFLALREDP